MLLEMLPFFPLAAGGGGGGRCIMYIYYIILYYGNISILNAKLQTFSLYEYIILQYYRCIDSLTRGAAVNIRYTC